MNFYNGYTPNERSKKLRALHATYPGRSHPYYHCECHVCGDPTAKVAPHGEDYAEPYLWERPAVYAVCQTCHGRLHKRFADPLGWASYKLHIHRGGFGSDLKIASIKRELLAAKAMLQNGTVLVLKVLRVKTASNDWWDQLSVDPATLADTKARPRQ